MSCGRTPTRRQQAAARHTAAAARHVTVIKKIVPPPPPKKGTAAPKPVVKAHRSGSIAHPKQKVNQHIVKTAKVAAKTAKVHHSAASSIAARKKRQAARRAVKQATNLKFSAQKRLILSGKRAAAKAAKRRSASLHRVNCHIKLRHAGPKVTKPTTRVIYRVTYTRSLHMGLESISGRVGTAWGAQSSQKGQAAYAVLQWYRRP